MAELFGGDVGDEVVERPGAPCLLRKFQDWNV
jgi:hypothetical protein